MTASFDENEVAPHGNDPQADDWQHRLLTEEERQAILDETGIVVPAHLTFHEAWIQAQGGQG